MKLCRCSKGHFYDADSSAVCPLCAAAKPVVPPPDKADPRIAPSFLRYGTPEFCGRGSSGVVYRLVPKPAEYVVKVVRCETAAQEETVLHELSMGSRLHTLKGLVQIEGYDMQREGRVTYWSILERACSPLPECMQLAPLTEEEVLSLGIQLCDTLLSVRRSGCLHMDLQPKNVFRDQKGNWLLGDLGGIYPLEELASGKRVGTPAFMAPEVYRDGACSEKAVVYSLGMLLYAVLHQGKLPLEDRYPAETAVRKRLSGEAFLFPAQKEPGLRYLTPALLSDPSARPGLAEYRELLTDCQNRKSDAAPVPFDAAVSAPSPAPVTDTLTPGLSPVSGKDTLLPDDLAPQASLWGDLYEDAGYAAADAGSSAASDPFWDDVDLGMPAQAPATPDPFWDSFDLGMTASAPSAPVADAPDPFWGDMEPGMPAQVSGAPDPSYTDEDIAMFSPPSFISDIHWEADLNDSEDSMPEPTAHAPASAAASGTVSRPAWLDREDAAPAPPRPAAPMPPAPPRPAAPMPSAPPAPAPMPPAPARAEKAGGFFGRLFGGKKDKKPEASPVQSAPAPTPKPLPRLSEVQFSAVFPNRFLKGEYSILEMFLYEEEYHRVVEQAIAAAETAVKESRSGILQITEKADVCVLLECADQSVEIDGNGEHQTWYGKYLKFDFSVFLPEAYAKRQVMFTATVFFNGVPASKLRFTALCNTLREQKLELLREDILTAFVSYASEDRSRVATIIQGMKKARPDMDIFFDVETLRSGMEWEKALRAEIERRDILFLCWSRAARESRWVEREWRYALSNKGIECIEPIPIDPPDRCPPPAELASKCFRDRELLYIKPE